MSDAYLVSCRKDVTTQLTANVWATLGSQTIAAAGGNINQGYEPRIELRNVLGLNDGVPRPVVFVVAPGEDRTRGARGVWNREYTVQVGIRQKVVTEPTDTDVVMAFAEEVGDFLAKIVPAIVTQMATLRISIEASYDSDDLDQFKVLTAVVQISFVLWTT